MLKKLSKSKKYLILSLTLIFMIVLSIFAYSKLDKTDWVEKIYQIDSYQLTFLAPESIVVNEGPYGISIISEDNTAGNDINIRIAHSESPANSIDDVVNIEKTTREYLDYHLSSTAELGNYKPQIISSKSSMLSTFSGISYTIELASPPQSLPKYVVAHVYVISKERLFVVWDFSNNVSDSNKIISSITLTAIEAQ